MVSIQRIVEMARSSGSTRLMEMALQFRHCKFQWIHRTSRHQLRVLNSIMTIQEQLARTQSILQSLLPNRSILQRMVMGGQHIGRILIVHHRCRDRLMVLRSSECIQLQLVRIGQIVELVDSSSSMIAQHMGKVILLEHIVEWLHHSSKEKRLGFHTIGSIGLGLVDTEHILLLIHCSKRIQHMVMAQRPKRILQFVGQWFQDQRWILRSSSSIELVLVNIQRIVEMARSSDSIKLLGMVVVQRCRCQLIGRTSRGLLMVLHKLQSRPILEVGIEHRFVLGRRSSSILGRMEMALRHTRIVEWLDHKCKDQQQVRDSNQSIELGLVSIQQILGWVRSNSSIEHQELEYQLGSIIQLAHQTSRDQQLVLRIRQCIVGSKEQFRQSTMMIPQQIGIGQIVVVVVDVESIWIVESMEIVVIGFLVEIGQLVVVLVIVVIEINQLDIVQIIIVVERFAIVGIAGIRIIVVVIEIQIVVVGEQIIDSIEIVVVESVEIVETIVEFAEILRIQK